MSFHMPGMGKKEDSRRECFAGPWHKAINSVRYFVPDTALLEKQAIGGDQEDFATGRSLL